MILYVWFILGSIGTCISFYWYISVLLILIMLVLLKIHIAKSLKQLIIEESKGIVGWSQQERDMQKQVRRRTKKNS